MNIKTKFGKFTSYPPYSSRFPFPSITKMFTKTNLMINSNPNHWISSYVTSNEILHIAYSLTHPHPLHTNRIIGIVSYPSAERVPQFVFARQVCRNKQLTNYRTIYANPPISMRTSKSAKITYCLFKTDLACSAFIFQRLNHAKLEPNECNNIKWNSAISCKYRLEFRGSFINVWFTQCRLIYFDNILWLLYFKLFLHAALLFKLRKSCDIMFI